MARRAATADEAPKAKPAKARPQRPIPKTLGACADALYLTREERLREGKQVAELEAYEKAIKAHVIDTLPKSESTGVAGKVARVAVTTQKVPVVEDWDAFYKHVKKTGHFELLNRAVNAAAVQERWDAGKAVPGVGSFNVAKVSVTKI